MNNFYTKMKSGEKPYIIAELGANHNGDMELARKMILEAQKSGADCVKFQSWSKKTVFSQQKYDDNYFLSDDYRDRDDYTLEKIVDDYSVSEGQLLELKNYADSVKIDCTSTPFSNGEADFLVQKLNTPFIKIASMDLNNYPFLKYLANFKKPIVISIGLSTLYEIDKAIEVIEAAGNKEIVLLHCVSIYPPMDSDVNLERMETLRSNYPEYPVGFSDHTLGTCIPIAAAAKRACIIEKHFTLDKDMEGWDHKISANAIELKEICESSERVFNALGSGRISVVEDSERRQEFRRSIVTTREMKSGDIIKESDLDFKRPGNGVSPADLKYVVGRTLKNDIKNDYVLHWEDLL